MEQQPGFELGIREGEAVIVTYLRPAMEVGQRFVRPRILLVHHEPGFLGGWRRLPPEMILHALAYLRRVMIVPALQAGHPDHRVPVLQDGENLRLGLYALRGDHEPFAVPALAGVPLESAPLRGCSSSPHASRRGKDASRRLGRGRG